MKRRFLTFCRTLHIYMTLLGLAVILFFAVTGFMMNHDDWFGVTAVRVQEVEGRLDPTWLRGADRLDVVERLRRDFGIRQNMTDYEPDGDSIRVVFKGPGRVAEASIRPADGAVKLRRESRGLGGLLGDLHKGSEAGAAWHRVIDGVAILLAAGSVTGLLLWTSLRSRRRWGILALGAGAVVATALMMTAI